MDAGSIRTLAGTVDAAATAGARGFATIGVDVATVGHVAGAAPARTLPLFADAAAAIHSLGDGPLQPTGPVREALESGRLLRTGDPARLDALERRLRDGAVDRTSQLHVGGGMNGSRYRMRVADPADATAAKLWAVEKPAEAQAAQEELAWRLARELGIDHLLPATARRPDGAAWMQFRQGTTLSQAGIVDLGSLDEALTRSYLDDVALGLTPTEAAQAARVDRQLLQLLDYVLANNDRHLSNGLFDAAEGAGLTFLDFGHAGRGTAAEGTSLLRPSLRGFQAGSLGGHVEIDRAVLDLAERRLAPDRIRELHREVFAAPGVATPKAGSTGARFFAHVNGTEFREGMVQRLRHAVETGGYDHVEHVVSNAELPPMQDGRDVRGFRNVRHMLAGGGGFDRF